MALVVASEVLVSSTVKDPDAGSGLQFAERGERELKRRAKGYYCAEGSAAVTDA